MMRKIVDLQLNLLKERLKKQSLDLEVSEKIKDYLLKVGFDEIYGARPLKRVINELITDEIALQIVEGKIKPNDKIMVDFKNSKVIIEVRKVN
jgi:ATPases with chaperone activity, ATP-binding subunit